MSIYHGCPAMRLPPPASAGAGLWSSLARLLRPPAPQLAGGLLGLLEILVARAPEDDAAGYAPDGNGDVELASDRLQIAFHALRPDLRAQMDADRLSGEGLNLLAQRVVEHGFHAGPTAAHTAGFLERDVVELNAGGLLGHLVSRFLYEGSQDDLLAKGYRRSRQVGQDQERS
jgi:hypothetical protein